MGLNEYAQDPWNYNDLLNFILFVPIYVYGRYTDFEDNDPTKPLLLYQNIVFRVLCFIELISMMIKMMFLMRVYVGMGKIVELVAKVILKSYQFVLFLFAWIVAQSAATMILGIELEEPEMKL